MIEFDLARTTLAPSQPPSITAEESPVVGHPTHHFIHHHHHHSFYTENSTTPTPEVIVCKFGTIFPETVCENNTILTPNSGEHIQVINKLQRVKEESIDDCSIPLSPSSPGSLILDPLTLKKKKKSHLSRDELTRVCQGGDVTFEPYNESPYMVAIRCLSDRKSLIGYRCEWHSCGYMNARVERMLGHIRSQHPNAPPVKKLPITNTPPSSIRPRSSSSLSTASSLSSGNPAVNLPFMFSPGPETVGDDCSSTPPPSQPPLSNSAPTITQSTTCSSHKTSTQMVNEGNTNSMPTVICQHDKDSSRTIEVNNQNKANSLSSIPMAISRNNGKLASLLSQKADSLSMTPEYSQQNNFFNGNDPTTPVLIEQANVFNTNSNNMSSVVDDNNNKHKQTHRASNSGVTEESKQASQQNIQKNKQNTSFVVACQNEKIVSSAGQQPLTIPSRQQQQQSQTTASSKTSSTGVSTIPSSITSGNNLTQHQIHQQSTSASLQSQSQQHFGPNHSNIQSDNVNYFYQQPANVDEIDFAQSLPAYQMSRSFSQAPSDYSKSHSHTRQQQATTHSQAASLSHGQSTQPPQTSSLPHPLSQTQHQVPPPPLPSSQLPQQQQPPPPPPQSQQHQFASGDSTAHHNSLLNKSSSLDNTSFSPTVQGIRTQVFNEDVITNEFSLDLDHMLDHDTNSSTGSSGKKFKKVGTGSKNYIGKQNLFQEFLSEDVNKVRDPENRYIIALQKNMKIVGYRCDWPDCEFLTCRKYVMVNHINGKHINQRPFSCPLCSFNFVKRYFLKAHMQKVHKRRISVDCKEELTSPKKRDTNAETEIHDGTLKRSKSEHPGFGHMPDDIPALQTQYSLDSSAPDYNYGYTGYNSFNPNPLPPPVGSTNNFVPNSARPPYPDGFQTNLNNFEDFLTPPSSISSSGSVTNYQQSYVETPMSNSATTTFSFLHTPSSSPALSSLSPAAGGQATSQNTPQPQYTPPNQAYPPAPFLSDYNPSQFPTDPSKFYSSNQPYDQSYTEQFTGAYEQNFESKPYDVSYRNESGECWNNSTW